VATILTGQYPSSHGTVHKMDFLADRVQTAAEALRDQGYWTAAFTTNINVAPIFNLNQGFAEFEYIAPSFYFGASDSATKLAIYKGLRTARERFFADRVYYEHFYQDALVVNEHVGEWLASKPPEPFFLFVHYMDPHDPYFEMPYNGHGVARVMNPSPPLDRAEELHSLYLQGVRYHDDGLRALVEQLKQAGVYDSSAIAVTADHGEEFAEHGDWWHGTSLYEEQIHVPLVIVRPGRTEAGGRRSDPVRSIDIAPTLFGVAGLSPARAFQGVDLFAGKVGEALVAEEDLEGNSIVSVRSGQWKLLEANRDNPRGLQPVELYDLDKDPGEKNNLAAAEAARVEELRRMRREVLGR
jgi:arylsulfatase A-like enzyme